MQSNYSELPNVMSVADAKAFAAQQQAASQPVLVYRGATYTLLKQYERTDQMTEGRSRPAGTQLHYRGASYTVGVAENRPSQASRVASQSLIYRGATYIKTAGALPL